MKKKALILFIVIILILIGTFFVFYKEKGQNIRKEVLVSLKENLEFCEILQENINFFSRQGEFWLICNGRPFYTKYENGEVKTELNGWSFLKKEPSLWKELEGCDFYDSRDSQLIFYCPKDFDSEKLTAKVYNFDKELLQMNKIEEKDFLEIIANDIESVYSFLSTCEIKDFVFFKSEEYPAVIGITFSCSDVEYVVYTDLATVPLQPPILMNPKLSYEQRARISFEKSFGLPIENIETINNQVTIDFPKFEVRYFFSEPIPGVSYYINKVYDEEGVEIAIKEFGKYFIFPPIEKIETIEFIGEIYDNVLAFRINNKDVISVSYTKSINSINAFWKKTEGVYR